MEFICYADWAQLPDSAEALFAQAAGESVFFSRPWFENLTQSAPTGRERLLACVVEHDEVLAILPLEKHGDGVWYALTNLYSSLYTLLLAEHRRDEAIECLARGLYQLPFRSLRLEPIAEDDRNMQDFQRAMESLSITCQRRFRFFNWIHRCDGQDFSDYMQSRPARVRNSIARKERKLAREHGWQVRLYTASGLEQAMADYRTVYDRSWKPNELYEGFVGGLAEHLSEQGWLRLAVLYVEERPIAAQFWFVVHGKASIFKLVYDAQWKHYSPGSILTKYLMQHVIDIDGVSEIDFLTGNDAYKQDWMSTRRERVALYCINDKPRQRGGPLTRWFRGLMSSQHS